MTKYPLQNHARGGLTGLADYIRDNSWSQVTAVTVAFIAADVAMSRLPAGQHGSTLETAMVAVVLACLAVALLSRKWLPIGLTVLWLFATLFRI